MSTPGWVGRPAPKEEGRRKTDGHGSRARLIGGGGGKDVIFTIGVDPQLRIMEKMG